LFYPSPHGLNWKTPKTLVRSVMNNYQSHWSHIIGHANVFVSCSNTTTANLVETQTLLNHPDLFKTKDRTYLMTGMTNSDDQEMKKIVLEEGYGFNAMFYTFKGRLYTPKEIHQELPSAVDQGTLAFMQYQISNSTCLRLLKYYQEYKARNYDSMYGLANHPRKGEGSGCSAFAISFLDVAGLLEPWHFNVWGRTLKVPAKYIGGPETGRKVSINTLLSFFSNTSWAQEKEAAKTINFWDPERAFNWITHQWRKDQSNMIRFGYQPARFKHALGFIVDRSQAATPTEPIWQNK